MNKTHTDWLIHIFQALVAVVLVVHLIWPPIPLPSIEPLLASAGLDMFWDYDDFRRQQGEVFGDVATMLLSWIVVVFWVALAVGLMRFVPVARALLLLLLAFSGINYLIWWVKDPFLWYGDAPPLVVLTLNAVVVLLAFSPPISRAFAGYREQLKAREGTKRFPLFRSENAIPFFVVTAVLVVLVGNRLLVEDWTSVEISLEEDVGYSMKALTKARKSGDTDIIAFAYSDFGRMYLRHGEYQEAIRVLEEAYSSTGKAEFASELAWRYATSPDRDARDGKRAVELATEGLSSVEDDLYAKSRALAALAAAYAEAGNYADAISVQKHAVMARIESEETYDLMKYVHQLMNYRDGQPWRDHDVYRS